MGEEGDCATMTVIDFHLGFSTDPVASPVVLIFRISGDFGHEESPGDLG